MIKMLTNNGIQNPDDYVYPKIKYHDIAAEYCVPQLSSTVMNSSLVSEQVESAHYVYVLAGDIFALF